MGLILAVAAIRLRMPGAPVMAPTASRDALLPGATPPTAAAMQPNPA